MKDNDVIHYVSGENMSDLAGLIYAGIIITGGLVGYFKAGHFNKFPIIIIIYHCGYQLKLIYCLNHVNLCDCPFYLGIVVV